MPPPGSWKLALHLQPPPRIDDPAPDEPFAGEYWQALLRGARAGDKRHPATSAGPLRKIRHELLGVENRRCSRCVEIQP
jgi:hypothetical protein